MRALPRNDVESELSYAYLHAVASRAGMACSPGNRHEDNNGIDATLTAWGPFEGGGYLSEVSIRVQLKATIASPNVSDEKLHYFLKSTSRYDDLRDANVGTPRILVVLFLPQDEARWLRHTEDALAIERCAYWESLRGAPPCDNQTGVTVYLPKANAFSPEALKTLMAKLSRRVIPTYSTAS